MAQSRGLRPPPLGDGNRLRGTPFGHMALYIESASVDEERLIRQCREGERGGLVVTVDKQLKDTFFIAIPRNEFFYGPLDHEKPPVSVSRADIQDAFDRFNEEYGLLYREGPGISGFGQDYGILYIRKAWGIVYPTTREEEARIIDCWREHIYDEFHPVANNCVTMVTESLNRAGLFRRTFIRGRAPYNAYIYAIKKLLLTPGGAKASGGTYLRRDGSYVTEYDQLGSDAVMPSHRPFNVYTLRNLEYLIWLSPEGEKSLPGAGPIAYDRYPTGREVASGEGNKRFLITRARWLLSKPDEFIRLCIQSCKGIWYLINPVT